MPTFAARECRVVSATDPYYRILDFLDRRKNVLMTANLEVAGNIAFTSHCVLLLRNAGELEIIVIGPKFLIIRINKLCSLSEFLATDPEARVRFPTLIRKKK
jgi:hypothetical protein